MSAISVEKSRISLASKALEYLHPTYLHLKSNAMQAWSSVSMNSAMVSGPNYLDLSEKRIAWASDRFWILENLENLFMTGDLSNATSVSIHGQIY